ncbi:MAG: hypothetical protein J6Q85_04540 [Clostridia bacterium]|nr:hypothetical protein [Clostridia bacterium]
MSIELQEAKCGSCGENIKINLDKGKTFCPYCGTEYVAIKSEESLDEKLTYAKSQLLAKNYDTVKQVAEEIQRYSPTNFYGWYYAAICTKENPIEGKAGQVLSALNTVSSNILTSIQYNKSVFGNRDKIAEMNEKYTVGIKTQGAITSEKFIAYVSSAISSIENYPEEKRSELYSLIFDLLGKSISEVWECFETKTYRKRNTTKKTGSNGTTYKVFSPIQYHETHLTQMKQLIFSIVDLATKTKASNTKEYGEFFEKIGSHYKQIERKLYLCKAKKELSALFEGIEAPTSPSQYNTHSIISLIGGISSFLGVGIVGSVVGILFAILSKNTNGSFDTMSKAGLGLGCVGGILSMLLMFI